LYNQVDKISIVIVVSMASTILVGSTGLVGSHILSTLLALPTVTAVHAIARRQPKISDGKLQTVIELDSSKWASEVAAIQPTPSIFFSALGTTRGQAGGVENQRKIDYDLNVELAKAAKAAGVKVYVMISTNGANSKSINAYVRMKGELDEAVKSLDFDHTVIVKPGLIVGSREDSRPAEAIVRGIAKFTGAISGGWLSDGWSQDADVIAKAAISAGLKALEGDAPKVWELAQADVIRLGRKEWKS